MNITCYGSAREVTGACYLIEANGHRVLLECGSFQGSRESEKRNARPFPFNPTDIDAVILSHAHLDHSGRIPKLVKDGFKGPIYAQRATVDIAQIILTDAAFINEKDAEWENRRRKHHQPKAQPLYTIQDAQNALKYFRGLDYHRPTELLPGIRCTFHDAGHILGSSIVDLELTDSRASSKHRSSRVVFTGDLGHSGAPLLRDPDVLSRADMVMMEGTYGDRNHRTWNSTWEELGQVLQDANQNRGNILIPAFAIGRTQELLYVFKKHYEEWGLDNWRIFLDSPMASKATEVYQKHRHLYDDDALAQKGDLFDLPNLRICQSPEDSMALNQVRSGAIIIAGSGMCSGGRIRHHLKHHVGQSGCHIIIVGFQARGTLGRSLVDGAKIIRLWGEVYPVRARVHTINGLSAHADQERLLQWYSHFENRPPATLVHGEEDALSTLAGCLRQRFNTAVRIPEYGEIITW